MATDILGSMKERLEDDLTGISRTEEGLRAVMDSRYGEIVVRVDHDVEAASVRVSVVVPPPAGAGPDFLVWCLSINAQYWDVKIGLDDDGLLLVHADLDAEPSADVASLTTLVIDRVDTIVELLDDDLVPFLLEHGLGTPPQQTRWRARGEREERDEHDA